MNTLLIIGNGPSADTPAVAAAMQVAGRVMRMNNFRAGQYISDRCDIWGTSLNADVVLPPVLPAHVWWTGWPRPVAQDGMDPLRITRTAARRDVQALCDLLAPWHPSTGLILAQMAISLGFRIVLAGFDHFEAAAHHHWPEETDEQRAIASQASQWHNPAIERASFSRMVATGAAEFLRT